MSWFEQGSVPTWLQVFGRLHAVLLHLPIGLLAGLAALEALASLRRSPGAARGPGALAWLAAVSAAAAAASGFILSREEGYGGQTVRLHLWLGAAVAGAALVTALLHARESRALFRLGLLATLALLVPAGHLGGTMTHGAGFLTRPLLAAAATPAATAAEGSSTYALVIAPIFRDRCAACHGPAKRRGGLALHTAEGILAGGETGAVIVAGVPLRSEMVRRLRLGLDDDDHMPPPGRPQPSESEIAALESWIAAGAPFEGLVAGPGDVAAQPPENADPAAAGAPSPPPADPAALAILRERLVHVQPLERNSGLLWVDFGGAPATTDADCIGLLSPLIEHIGELSLARTAVTDEVLALVSRMENLERLDLRATALTGAGLAALRGHGRLQVLVAARTGLTDAALDHLRAMPALRRVHLWQCGVSPEGVARLRAERPDLAVETGDGGPAAALESESEIRLSGDAPLPGAHAPAGAVSLEPLNTACPVSGRPVDPRYRVVHEGRVVGFCCPECPARFWAEPAKFSPAVPR